MEWISRLAAELDVEPPDAQETARLLDSAREVAHRVERKVTPLATFVLGMGVAARIRDGQTRDEAFDAALAAVSHLLPPEA